MVRWNIQEVPLSFNLFDTPNMGAARVLQNAPDGYMVFITNHPKKGLYHVVVVTPEEGEKIKKGSMKGDYKYQVKNIHGLTSAKIAALELLTQVMEFSEALVKDEMTPREKLLRQRFNIGNKITKDVIFEIHEIGNEIIIMAKGKTISSHKFMKFSQLVAGQPYFIADNPFKNNTYKIIDSPYLNMVRDFFIVRSYYFQDSGKFTGPTYTLEEIKIWFDNFDDVGWMDKMTVSKEVKQILINRSNTMDPLNLTNEFIPFTYVNTHYRDRGNRSNPSNIVIVKGGSNGIIKLNAKTTRGNNKLKELNVRFAPNFFDESKEQSIREIVNTHIKKYKDLKGYKTLTLQNLASEIIASIMTWIYLPLKTERLSVNAWDGNVWSNDPCWIYDEESLEDTILEPLKPAWGRYYP
tara:strand:+ start:322 stop:1545 length:1224 start_codon:yes stop_codon:yes gene_type:complete